METKIKYLGQFKLDYKIDVDYEKDWNEVHKLRFEELVDSLIPAYVNIKDESDYYESELFMRSNINIEDIGQIHGVYGETNNSSIVLQYDEDDCEVVKLWRIW